LTHKKRTRPWTPVAKQWTKRLVKREIEKADEHFQSASRNLADNDLATAANRLYFAVERATVALMIGMDGQLSKNHGYIQYGFDSFCDRNLLPRSRFRGWLARQYKDRIVADYGNWRRGSTPLSPSLMATRLSEGAQIIRSAKQTLSKRRLLSP